MSAHPIPSPPGLDGHHDRRALCIAAARSEILNLVRRVEAAGWKPLEAAEAMLRLGLENVDAIELAERSGKKTR